MCYQSANVQFSREDKTRDLPLKGKIGGVTSDQVLFINTNGGQIHVRLFAAFRMREQQHLTAAAEQLLGLSNDRRLWHSNDSRVETSSSSNALYQLRKGALRHGRVRLAAASGRSEADVFSPKCS
jgi:hypothetical protein